MEFRHDDPNMEGLYTSGRLVDTHAVQHGYSILCFDTENAYFHAEEDVEVYCWLHKEWSRGITPEADEWKILGGS